MSSNFSISLLISLPVLYTFYDRNMVVVVSGPADEGWPATAPHSRYSRGEVFGAEAPGFATAHGNQARHGRQAKVNPTYRLTLVVVTGQIYGAQLKQQSPPSGCLRWSFG